MNDPTENKAVENEPAQEPAQARQQKQAVQEEPQDEQQDAEATRQEQHDLNDNSADNANGTNTVTFEEQVAKAEAQEEAAEDRGNTVDNRAIDRDPETDHTTYVAGIEPNSKKIPDEGEFIKTAPNVLQEGQSDTRDGKVPFVELAELKTRADRIGLEYADDVDAKTLQKQLSDWSANKRTDAEVRADQRAERLKADKEAKAAKKKAEAA